MMTVAFTVLVGKKLAVVGFRYPPSKSEPGKGENVEREGERRVASHLFAVLGQPSSLQRHWTNRSSAEFIANAIPRGRVGVVKVPDAKKRR